MATFVEYKDKVSSFIGSCIDFAKANGFEKQLPAMQDCKARVDENKIVIVAVGEARRGKSSLLSAYLEDEGLFPVDVAVTTCLATAVSYGETEKITVTLEDGTKKEITRSQIQEYASEKYNENNKKNVRWIEILTPNEKLKDGITVVDTPGVGSLNPQHTEVTYSFLPNADVVLFVSDAAAELTNPELIFLKSVKKHCENFLFILTKKDLKSDFCDIIEGNKKRIEEFADMPAESIKYIPVSSTMKLASLENGSERMAKSSNFSELEAAIWDNVENKRADILINPQLAGLALCLSEIEKEMHIRETGLSGMSEETESLRSKLKQLQEDRQRLLSESALWQLDIQREIDGITADQNRMMINFRNEANDALEAGLKITENLRHPEQLLNEIILMASSASYDICEEAHRRLCTLKADFEEKTKLSLYNNIVKNELKVDDSPTIVFEKQKPLDKFISYGRKMSYNSMGGAAAGGLLGGIIGGIAGFMVAGPAGAYTFAMYGASLGGGAGGIVGGAKGVAEAVKPGDDAPKLRQIISKYINQTVETWRIDDPQYLKEISHSFIKSLRESIKANQKVIENDIEQLQRDSSLTAENRAAMQKRLAVVKAEYSKLAACLNNIKSIAVVSEPSALAAGGGKAEAAVTGGNADYSHLED